MREGYVEIAKGVGVPLSSALAPPEIRWKHIDGPMLIWAGHCHWLTWRERFLLWVGYATPESLAYDLWPVFRTYHQ